MSKRALEVADQIEEAVCDLGWETGSMIGDETALMSRYDVGRSVFRQAIRLSEHLGVASMRRGRSGGLVVAQPTSDPAVLSLQIAWSKQRIQARSALRLCKEMQAWHVDAPAGANVLLNVIDGACAGFASDGPVHIRSMGSAKLGEQIAQSMLQTLVDLDWDTPELLGSEAELMERFGAGRASLREAVHLLELHGVAAMQRGPGGGLLILRSPASGAVSRSIRAQLRSHGHTDQQICGLLDCFLDALPAADMQDPGLVLRTGASELIEALCVDGKTQTVERAV